MEKKKEKNKAFLLEALAGHLEQGYLSFHTPGHKGKGIPQLQEILGEKVFQADLTELPGLDDLHNPSGPIRKAERKAAECFGAAASKFLINGATAGIQAAMLACLRPGDKVLISRNMHRSVLSALIITGAEPVYLLPDCHPELGIPLGLKPGLISASSESLRGCRALVLVYPTYEGLAANLERLTESARQLKLVTIADEAHGAHFKFHQDFPAAALEAGADVVIQGAHKTLGSLTQTAFLHLGSFQLERQAAAALSLMQSTSPSYILLASLDAALSAWKMHGRQLAERALKLAGYMRARINSLPGFYVAGEELEELPGVGGWDPTKLLVVPRGLAINGGELAELLRKAGIQVEAASENFSLFLITAFDDQEKCQKAVKALEGISRFYQGSRNRFGWTPLPFFAPRLAATPREAYFSPVKKVKLEEARQEVSAEMVAPYPPGIPVICPGEIITDEVQEALLQLRRSGVHYQGSQDSLLRYIMVVR